MIDRIPVLGSEEMELEWKLKIQLHHNCFFEKGVFLSIKSVFGFHCRIESKFGCIESWKLRAR